MQQNGSQAYLVNTGWDGSGKRISIKATRRIIDSILDGSLDKAETAILPVFNLAMPTDLPGVDNAILDPRNSYADASQWSDKAQNLASLFVENFVQYTDTDSGKKLVSAGPSL
jgi:phosphoenolpyruvate carboxykinase (ATP)